jgi:hypothetical protein
MSKYMPGPWGATTRRGSWDWVVYQVSDPNNEVCQMFHDGSELNEMGETNAHLIAAAPDMLEALKGLLALVENVNPGAFNNGVIHPQDGRDEGEFKSGFFMDDARAAIAKAEGQS